MFSNNERTSGPLDENAAERLFLLDCHVSKIDIPSSNLFNNPDKSVCQQTRVTVSFLNFSELELCDEQNEEQKKRCYTNQEPCYLCGKSFIFALPRQFLLCFAENPVYPYKFSLTIKVYEMDAHNKGTMHTLLGFSKIPLAERFAEILRISSEEVMNQRTSCSLQEDFHFLNPDGLVVGVISAFVRIGCFGKIIETQLHRGPDQSRRESPTDLTRSIIEPFVMHGASLPPCNNEPGNYIHDSFMCDTTISFFDDETLPYCAEYYSTPAEQSKFIDACTSPTRSLEELNKELRVGDKSESMMVDSEIKRNLIENLKRMEWVEVFGYPENEETSKLQEHSGEKPQSIRKQSIEELAEPEYAYEEIQVKVNEHTLILKAMKSTKTPDKQAPADESTKESVPEKYAVEPNVDLPFIKEYAKSPAIARSKNTVARSKAARQPLQSPYLDQVPPMTRPKFAVPKPKKWNRNLSMGTKAKRSDRKSRFLQAYKYDEHPDYSQPPHEVGDYHRDCTRGNVWNAPKVKNPEIKRKFGNPLHLNLDSLDPEMELEVGLGTQPTQCLLIGSRKTNESAEKSQKVKQELHSKGNEVFSLNVGEKCSMDGKVQPKIILKIRASKKKEELKPDNSSVKKDEEKLQEKERGKEFVAKETQYNMADLVDLSIPPKKLTQPASKSKGGNKPKKGKKK